jgi:hypothetical protein
LDGPGLCPVAGRSRPGAGCGGTCTCTRFRNAQTRLRGTTQARPTTPPAPVGWSAGVVQHAMGPKAESSIDLSSQGVADDSEKIVDLLVRKPGRGCCWPGRVCAQQPGVRVPEPGAVALVGVGAGAHATAPGPAPELAQPAAGQNPCPANSTPPPVGWNAVAGRPVSIIRWFRLVSEAGSGEC